MSTIKSPSISETAIRFDFNVDELLAHDFDNECHFEKATFIYFGCTWKVSMTHDRSGMLHVFIERDSIPINLMKTTTAICSGLRFIKGDFVQVVPPESDTMYSPYYYYFTYTGVMSIKDLTSKFCTNRIFTVEFYFPQPLAERVGLSAPATVLVYRSPTLATAVFKEISITCHGVDVAMCNKSVIGRESKMAFGAFSNVDSVESQTKSFAIDHDIATPETSLMLIRLMYEEWDSEMDAQARDLLVLADYMDCERISAIIIMKLGCLLTLETFWPTCAVAILLKEAQPALFDLCTQYASTPNNRMYELLNRPVDERSDKTGHVVATAVASMRK